MGGTGTSPLLLLLQQLGTLTQGSLQGGRHLPLGIQPLGSHQEPGRLSRPMLQSGRLLQRQFVLQLPLQLLQLLCTQGQCYKARVLEGSSIRSMSMSAQPLPFPDPPPTAYAPPLVGAHCPIHSDFPCIFLPALNPQGFSLSKHRPLPVVVTL